MIKIKHIVVFCSLFLMRANVNAQSVSNDISCDTAISLTDNTKAGIAFFVSPDIGEYYYYNNNYFNYILSVAGVSDSSYVKHTYATSLQSGSFSPNTYRYNITSSFYRGAIGMNISAGNSGDVTFNHVIALSFERNNGSFYSAANYSTVMEDGISYAQDTITDVFQCSYVQTSVGLHYRFQPTFKWFFLSAGINCNFNFIRINVQRNKDIYGAGHMLDGSPTPAYYHYSNQSDTTYNGFFVNFPFEFGAGARISIHKFLIEPAFYVTTGFMKGFLVYDASLQIAYKID